MIPAHCKLAGKFFSSLGAVTITAAVFTGWLGDGCAPLPPIDEDVAAAPEAASEPQFTKAQRDSMIAVYRSFAYENWKNGDYPAASRHFNTVRKLDLEHQQNIYRSWSDCFVRQSMLDSALFAYEEGIQYFPDDSTCVTRWL